MDFKKILSSLLLFILFTSLNAQILTVISDGGFGFDLYYSRDTLIIDDVDKGSAADKAGLMPGDIILSVNGSEVTGAGLHFPELNPIVHNKAGTEVGLKIFRKQNESIFECKVKLKLNNKLNYDCFFDYMVDSTGLLTLEEISSNPERIRFNSVIEKGTTIYSVNAETIATELGLMPGDRFMSFDDGFNNWKRFWSSDYNDYDTISKVLRDSLIFDLYADLRDYKDLYISSVFYNDLRQGDVWLRIIFDTRLTEDKSILLRVFDIFDNIVLYQRSGDGSFRVKKTGTLIASGERDAFFKGLPVMRINIRETKQDTVYIHAVQEGGFNHPPTIDILSYDYVVWFENIERLILGSMLGMMLLISLYFLILYAFLKVKSYLVYLLFILSLSFTLFHVSGYGAEFIWPNSILFVQRISILFTVIPLSLLMFFGSMYLEVRKSFPRHYKIGIYLLTASLILSIFFWLAEFVDYDGVWEYIFIIVVILFSLSFILLISLTILITVKRMRQNFRPAKYFLAGLIILIVSLLMFLFADDLTELLVGLFNFPLDVTAMILNSSLFIGAIFQFLILAVGLSQKMRDSDLEMKETQENLIVQLQENEKLKDKVNRELEHKVTERTKEIEEQKYELQVHQKEITDSINYAKRIQSAVLPPEAMLKDILPEHFVLFKPRDIVSGDFYWVRQIKNFTVVVAADCTGHGVPGAFMSMLGMSFLNELVTKSRFDTAGELLNSLRKKVKDTLKQEGKDMEQKDGMDLALAIIDNETLELQFSGAFNPIYIVRGKDKQPGNEVKDFLAMESDKYNLIEIKGDRQPISIHYSEKAFKTKYFQLLKQDTIYLFSDGYHDQMGGPDGKKFMSKKFKKLILDIQGNDMAGQNEILDDTLEKWKGKLPQIDDIIVFGIQWS